MTKQYAERDAMALDEAGGHYMRHVMAMTGEKLHGKGDIAAELGWRDMQIAALQQKLDAVLAENKILDGAIGAIADAYETGMADLLAKEIDTAVNIETPVTDAILNEVRAEGVEMYAQSLRRKQEDAFTESEYRHTKLGRAAVSAEKFAAQLRAGFAEGGV